VSVVRVPSHLVVLDDVASHEKWPVAPNVLLGSTTVHLSVSDFPVKVPLTFLANPLEGKDPEYLVGMSVAASTAAGINPAVIITPRRQCMFPSPVGAITRLSAISMGRQKVVRASRETIQKGSHLCCAVHVLGPTVLLSWSVRSQADCSRRVFSLDNSSRTRRDNLKD
jgi:hypothetical protein